MRYEPSVRGVATQAHVHRYAACLVAEAHRHPVGPTEPVRNVITEVQRARQLLMREQAVERGGYD